jgi:hypothetical protein
MTDQPTTEATERPDQTPEFVEVVARQIRILAARDNVSLSAVGESVGLRHPALSKRMAGDVGWSLTDLLALARYFRVPLSTITPDTLTEDVIA